MEKWPYPNVPVYVVCPRDREGCSQTLHRNYLLPINSNIGQDDKDAPMAGVENNTTSTPVPPVDSEPADAGPSGMVTSSTADSIPQGSLDQTAPLRCSIWKTQNQLLWRYQNFGLLADTRPSNIWDAWIDLCICLHVIFCLYTIFWRSTVWITLYLHHHAPAKDHWFWHWGGFSQCNLSGGFFGWESGPKVIWPKHDCPTRK